MTTSAITSSNEAGVLVAHHRATARPFPKEARTITGGVIQSPTITIPTGEHLNVPYQWSVIMTTLSINTLTRRHGPAPEEGSPTTLKQFNYLTHFHSPKPPPDIPIKAQTIY
ncbi:hypothetical protein AVEN_222214-1 [Araneus ventricosus]|uniref:Uncharacterized protein n=1 Tax=Araneus ventricosus TaxID=182803 RepID=A0A4Y2EV95_ARAVE|nr:hypothetical protein AVEN_222214-1 [Araneus ventricosus]